MILLNHYQDPMTLSEDDEGVYDHLPNPWYLGSRKPFSGKVSQKTRVQPQALMVFGPVIATSHNQQ